MYKFLMYFVFPVAMFFIIVGALEPLIEWIVWQTH